MQIKNDLRCLRQIMCYGKRNNVLWNAKDAAAWLIVKCSIISAKNLHLHNFEMLYADLQHNFCIE